MKECRFECAQKGHKHGAAFLFSTSVLFVFLESFVYVEHEPKNDRHFLLLAR